MVEPNQGVARDRADAAPGWCGLWTPPPAYYVDSPDQLLRAATLLADHGTTIERGPGMNGTSGAVFLYFFEPEGDEHGVAYALLWRAIAS